MPPELWRLKTDEPNWNAMIGHADGGRMAQLPSPRAGVSNPSGWGDASFIGPCHDIIVCDVNGGFSSFLHSKHDKT